MNIATEFELCSTMYFHTSKTYIQVFLSKFKFDPSLIIYLCNLEPTDKYTYMTYTHTHTYTCKHAQNPMSTALYYD